MTILYGVYALLGLVVAWDDLSSGLVFSKDGVERASGDE